MLAVTRAFVVKTVCPQTAPTACNTQNNCDLKKIRAVRMWVPPCEQSTKCSLKYKDHNQKQASPWHYFTLMENTDTTSLLLLSKHNFPLKYHLCEWDKEGFVYRAALLPKTIWCGSSTCLHTSWLVKLLFFFSLRKIGLVLDRFLVIWLMHPHASSRTAQSDSL